MATIVRPDKKTKVVLNTSVKDKEIEVKILLKSVDFVCDVDDKFLCEDTHVDKEHEEDIYIAESGENVKNSIMEIAKDMDEVDGVEVNLNIETKVGIDEVKATIRVACVVIHVVET